jgi:hypothetical protein
LRDIARTPGLRIIRASGKILGERGLRPFENAYKVKDLIQAKRTSSIPPTLSGTITMWGELSAGIAAKTQTVIDDINRLRLAEGLGPLPDGVVCEDVDQKRVHPMYRLSLSVLPMEDRSTSRD